MSDGGMSDDEDDRYSPNVPEYWAFGCLDICYGKAERVPDNSRVNPLCGRADPSCVFVCAACNKLFHADCVRLFMADKARIKNFNRLQQRSSSATADAMVTCPTCLVQISATWRTAQADTTAVVKIMSAAATSKGVLRVREATELAGTILPPLDASMLVRYSKLAHAAKSRREDELELQQLAKDILHGRQPEQDALNPDLAEMCLSLRRKIEKPSPGREEAMSNAQPPPTTARAGMQLYEAVMPAKKRAHTQEDEDKDEALDDVAAGACTVCGGGPSSFSSIQSHRRHFQLSCHLKRMLVNVPTADQSMDRRVFCNHQRVVYQSLKLGKRGRPSKKQKRNSLNAAFRAASSTSMLDDDDDDDDDGGGSAEAARAEESHPCCYNCTAGSPGGPGDNEQLWRCLGYDLCEVGAFILMSPSILDLPRPPARHSCSRMHLSLCNRFVITGSTRFKCHQHEVMVVNRGVPRMVPLVLCAPSAARHIRRVVLH